MAKTVFVLGAGASKEVNLPIGEELKAHIAKALDFRSEFGHFKSGDALMFDALRLHVTRTNSTDRGESIAQAARRICNAMPQASSIDSYIDAHNGDVAIELCGKLAIVRSILMAERKSLLFIDPRTGDQMNHPGLTKTWFSSFWKTLTDNCRRTDLEERFRSISIVSFNYDRCIEHYLYHAVQNYYHLNDGEAASLLKCLEVFHPYGRVGSLPWQQTDNAVMFGEDVTTHRLLDLSSQIKTFTEGTDPSSSDIANIRTSMRAAERWVFLGFAFHSQNLSLLWPTRATASRGGFCIGTALEISPSDMESIRNELADLTGLNPAHVSLRNNLTCFGLFGEYRRPLSSLSCRS